MKLKVNDCLKYWRVIRYFIKSKYGLTTSDLDMLLFLYSEDEFDSLLSWNEARFDSLLRDGWIEVFRKRRMKHKTLYGVTFKTQRVISSVYKKLSGEEIPTSLNNNPIFAKNVKYSDKAYRKMILEMNHLRRRQQRLSPE